MEKKSQELSAFGKVINFYLERNKMEHILPMNKKQLAEAIGVDRANITYWMQGKYYPEIENLERLLKAFKIDFRDFAETAHRLTDWGKFSKNHPK